MKIIKTCFHKVKIHGESFKTIKSTVPISEIVKNEHFSIRAGSKYPLKYSFSLENPYKKCSNP